MKNKKLLYILIPVVLLVWGVIIYRIFNVVNGSNSNEVLKSVIIENVNNENLIDTFSIHPNYRDPFISKRAKKTTSENKVVSAITKPDIIKKVTNTVPVSNKWPNIVYNGLIKNEKSNKQLALVQINGQANILQLGNVAEGVELTKIFRDSIEVKFNLEKRYIRK
ncbi:MAG: hypothetical protein V4511_15420 [Bacteroidota bacterium]